MSLKQALSVHLQRSYRLFLNIPLLRFYTLKVRSRLSAIPDNDEYTLRLRTAGSVYVLLSLFFFTITVLFLMNPDALYLLTLILSAAVINGLALDAYVGKLQRKLLQQTVDLFAGVRHAYHRHGIVEESILEASEEAGKEVSAHGYKIYEALCSPKPQQSLESYYETSPGRFLKSFAGISYLIMEYGDKVSAGGSAFLKALSGLSKEIHLELLLLAKLDYLLKGLHVIALVPVFFTKPIERWARNNFPLMDVFYGGKFGMVTKICIYLIILVCYVLLQKIKTEEELTAVKPGAGNWEKRLYEHRYFRKLVIPFLPSKNSQAYIRTTELLKDTHCRMRVEWFYVRRLVYFATSFAVALSLFIFLHGMEKAHILHHAATSQMMFGSMTAEEKKEAAGQAADDRKIMEQLRMSDKARYEAIAELVAADNHTEPLSRERLAESVNRIAGKLDRWNSEVLQWWEVLIALLLAKVAYYAPYWLLLFQRRVRLMDMKHEIYQFYTLISILREMERMSVEEIMEWLYSFAVIFKTPIEKCILHYEHGPEAALTGMKEEVSLPEFQRLADKLLLAESKIAVSKAFDDVESEMGYYFEQRRLDYEKTLDMKANLGKTIGFTPMYALVFMYLVIPLIWMSFSQLTVYYEQIQKL
ncbi:hypothetical protein [Paenibacillus caui]|uniref:hypothetical protein n=1 Tax=Paenibacillus caui TaxID=2873927 RepID=UPI001CA82663|nr:hypothetical protein [Paenibacillus caui]